MNGALFVCLLAVVAPVCLGSSAAARIRAERDKDHRSGAAIAALAALASCLTIEAFSTNILPSNILRVWPPSP
jgi:hypothetical protein